MHGTMQESKKPRSVEKIWKRKDKNSSSTIAGLHRERDVVQQIIVPMLLMQNLIDPCLLFVREEKKKAEESNGNSLTKQDRKGNFIYPKRSVQFEKVEEEGRTSEVA